MNKVFCIGLSGTGKHSLMEAFQMLGYTTVHYPMSFEEIDTYDVACDAFVWLHYKELDRKYPNSKFIYTDRDVGPWVNDILAHLKAVPPESKSPEKLKIREKVWGSTNPNAKQLQNAKNAHEKDIRSYFEARPHDLLIMNIPEGDNWELLCPFIGSEIPDIDFPHIDTSYN